MVIYVYLEDAWKDCIFTLELLTFLLHLLDVRNELIKEMVDDVGLEDLDLVDLGELPRFRQYLHVEH